MGKMNRRSILGGLATLPALQLASQAVKQSAAAPQAHPAAAPQPKDVDPCTGYQYCQCDPNAQQPSGTQYVILHGCFLISALPKENPQYLQLVLPSVTTHSYMTMTASGGLSSILGDLNYQCTMGQCQVPSNAGKTLSALQACTFPIPETHPPATVLSPAMGARILLPFPDDVKPCNQLVSQGLPTASVVENDSGPILLYWTEDGTQAAVIVLTYATNKLYSNGAAIADPKVHFFSESGGPMPASSLAAQSHANDISRAMETCCSLKKYSIALTGFYWPVDKFTFKPMDPSVNALPAGVTCEDLLGLPYYQNKAFAQVVKSIEQVPKEKGRDKLKKLYDRIRRDGKLRPFNLEDDEQNYCGYSGTWPPGT